MSGTLWLKCAAAVSFLMAAGQALISTWPAAAAYFHAPPSLLDNRVRLLMVGGTTALLPALFGLYALSGAGVIRRMPLVRTVLVARSGACSCCEGCSSSSLSWRSSESGTSRSGWPARLRT